MKYSFDTSAFIEAWNRHYPPVVFPTVWEHLEKAIQHNKIKAADEVYEELKEHGDELFKWAKKNRKMFVALDGDLQRRAMSILQRFSHLAKQDRTRPDADPFVIALALANNVPVVTYETPKPTQPRIPDVCQKLRIPCVTLVTVFEREGWAF
jgi:hypothetical protein